MRTLTIMKWKRTHLSKFEEYFLACMHVLCVNINAPIVLINKSKFETELEWVDVPVTE